MIIKKMMETMTIGKSLFPFQMMNQLWLENNSEHINLNNELERNWKKETKNPI